MTAHVKQEPQILGLAGSNRYNDSPVGRIACATDTFNQITRFVVMKRLSDPHGGNIKGQIYMSDPDLNRRLRAVAEERNYPIIEDEAGSGPNRVPIVLTSNDPAQIVKQRRELYLGRPLQCSCKAWRLKTQDEAKRDGLPWPPPEDREDERYFISDPEDVSGGAKRNEIEARQHTANGKTWPTQEIVGSQQIVCNPAACIYARGLGPDGQPSKHNGTCKPTTDIYCVLGDWGGGEPFIAHAGSWATAQRFNSSLARLMRQCGGNLAGVEIDLVLEFTKPQVVPGGSRRRHPYWTVAIPYGLSESEFRARAKANATQLLTDHKELARLQAMQTRLLTEGLHDGAMIQEFHPHALLLEANIEGIIEGEIIDGEAEATPDDAVSLTESERAVVDILVQRGGKTEAQAIALVDANAEDLDGLLENLGLVDDETEEAAPETEQETPTEAAPTEPVGREPPQPEAPAKVAPLFTELPASCRALCKRLGDKGVPREMQVKFVSAAWRDVRNRAETVEFSLRNSTDDEVHEMLTYLCPRVESWWQKTGAVKYGGEGQPTLNLEGE